MGVLREIFYSSVVRDAARLALRPVLARRRLPETPFTLRFPAWQHMGLMRPGGMNYQPEITHSIQRWVRPGQTVVDAGANIGIYSLMLAHFVGPSGAVHCFEPDPQSCRWLLENIRRNGLDQVKPWSLALSDADGVAELHLDLKATRTTSLRAEWELWLDHHKRQELRAATRRLDNLGLDRVDFIKIDVEGAELDVLRGARETITSSRPVVIVEAFGADQVEAVREFFGELGYEVADVRSGATPDLEAGYSGNLIATPQRSAVRAATPAAV